MRRLLASLAALLSLLAPTPALAQPPAWRPLDLFARNVRLEDLSFVDERNGWVIDREGAVYRTRDGGATWDHVYEFVDPHAPLRSIGFADTLHGWIGGLLGNPPTVPVLFGTADGGVTWTAIDPGGISEDAGFCGISVAGNSVYAVGRYFGPPLFARSHDLGQTWDHVDMSPWVGALVDCHFVSPDSGFLVGSTGFGNDARTVVLFTGDGGDTFVNRFTGTRENEQLWKIHFASPETAYASIQAYHALPPRFLRSVDGGHGWVELPFRGSPNDPQGCGFVTGTRGWIGGYSQLYETADGGATWTIATDFTQFNRMRVLSDTLAYAVGERAYKFSITPATVSVALASFSLAREDDAAVLRWETTDDGARLLFHVYRAVPEGPRERLTDRPLGHESRYAFTDTAPPGPRVDYWLQSIAPSGSTDWYGPLRYDAAPDVRASGLLSATPNPSSGGVRFAYRMDRPAHAELTIHDVMGRVVARRGPFAVSPGEHLLEWDGRKSDGGTVSPGVYYARLSFDGESSSLKIVRTK